MRVRNLATWASNPVPERGLAPRLLRVVEGQALVSVWNRSEKRREFAEMSVEDFTDLELEGAYSHPSHAGELEPSAATRREQLRQQLKSDVALINAKQWQMLAEIRFDNPEAVLAGYKAKGRLFTVLDEGRELYPAIQFLKNGEPCPVIEELLQHVPAAARGWPLLSWMNAGNVFLKDQKPWKVMHTEPKAMIEAAERFFNDND